MILNLIIVLILPVLFISIGIAVLNGLTFKMNNIIGYRTPRSMRCIRSWSWAQSMMGEYLLYDGAALSVLSIILVITSSIVLKESEAADIIPLIIIPLQSFSLLFVILKIESRLKKEHHRWDIK